MKSRLTRRQFVTGGASVSLLALISPRRPDVSANVESVTVRTDSDSLSHQADYRHRMRRKLIAEVRARDLEPGGHGANGVRMLFIIFSEN